MRATGKLTTLAAILALAGCSVDVPINPAAGYQPLDDLINGLQSGFEDAVEDPLGAKPFPLLMGGDSERVFYATNLTDIRLKFRGPVNDVILPGIIGPSNVYQLAGKQRELIRPLVPAGAFSGFATDGRFMAWMTIPEVESEALLQQIVVADLFSFSERVLYSTETDGGMIASSTLALNDGRLAFAIADDADFVSQRLRIEDLDDTGPAIEIAGGQFANVRLRGNRLAYVETSADGAVRIMLRDLSSEESIEVASDVRAAAFSIGLVLTGNTLVWSDESNGDLTRITAYDFATGESREWVDAARGRLAGATDDYVVTEERVGGRFPNKADRLVIRKYDIDGKPKQMADFRADGFAGQTRVLGDRVVWVNPDRRIVVQPLPGGDRKIFRPF